MDIKKDIRALTEDELTSILCEKGYPKFRASQLYDWLHKKCVNTFDEMNNIPKAMLEDIKGEYDIYSVKIRDCLISKIDGTRKYLMELNDGNIIECVLMKYEYGNTMCISSQVGCRMGCKFCASTIDGLVRNLTAGEMLGQIYTVSDSISERINHVVIMGSGEPFDNYDELLRFIRIITSKKGQDLAGRNITVSTCGIVPNILRLSDEGFSLTLAISLHATTDEKRKKIMPIANKYSIEEITKACKTYFEKTGRRLTLEYSLIQGVNDTASDARQLSNIAKSIGAHVNLIPVNPIKERDYVSTTRDGVMAFRSKLENNHVNATVRRSLGSDINAACGQLRREYLKSKEQGMARSTC